MGSVLFSMDGWKRKALRVSLQPKIGTEPVQQSYMLDNAIAAVGPKERETDTVKVEGLERKDSEALENYRPNTDDVSESKT